MLFIEKPTENRMIIQHRVRLQELLGSGARLLGVEGRPLGAPVEGHVDAAHDERRAAEGKHALARGRLIGERKRDPPRDRAV